MTDFKTELGTIREITQKIHGITMQIKESRHTMSKNALDMELINLMNYANVLETNVLKVENKYGIKNEKVVPVKNNNSKPNMINFLAQQKARELLS